MVCPRCKNKGETKPKAGFQYCHPCCPCPKRQALIDATGPHCDGCGHSWGWVKRIQLEKIKEELEELRAYRDRTEEANNAAVPGARA